jgi:hypothetical protein
LEEVTVCASHKVFMEVDDDILPIVSASQAILDQQLWPRPIHLLNIVIFIIKIIYIKLKFISLF